MAKKKAVTEKKYTYPEILKKYFPHASKEDLDSDEFARTTDNFDDILTKIKEPTIRPDQESDESKPSPLPSRQ